MDLLLLPGEQQRKTYEIICSQFGNNIVNRLVEEGDFYSESID